MNKAKKLTKAQQSVVTRFASQIPGEVVAPKPDTKKGPIVYYPAKENSHWPRPLTTLLRFAKGKGWRPRCAACGKTNNLMWTMLCPFNASNPQGFSMMQYPKDFAPLELVCSDHPIFPTKEITTAL